MPEMQNRRLAKLSSAERDEYLRLVELLQNPSAESSSQLSRLGELARKADHVCIDDTDENSDDPVLVDGEGYRQVWGEASRMRETGEILSFASSIRCPVGVIHGLEDSTPLEGVVRPIEPLLRSLSVHGIPRAGHYPWKELYAKELFYDVLGREIEDGVNR
jgi:pimeloyl-ACP methyl ester carboxylesterase